MLVLAITAAHRRRRRRAPRLQHRALPAPPGRRRQRAAAGLRQRPDRAGVDRHPGPHRRRALPGDGAHGVRRARRGEAARRDRRDRRRAPVVVGDPLSRARHRHRQRAARARERSRRRRRPPSSTLESADVAHSFWVPRLAGKTDLIPNRTNHMWIAPPRAGALPRAVRRVLRHAARAHAAAGLRAPARRVRALGRGAASCPRPPTRPPPQDGGVFETTACINCHTVRGTVATGRFGPDLTHLMSRATLAAGAAPKTPRGAARVDRRSRPREAGRAHAGDEARRRSRSTSSSATGDAALARD